MVEFLDIYIPNEAPHPSLRIRKRGDTFEITKKIPQAGDTSEQEEHTIILTHQEYADLAQLPGKRVKKLRYYYPVKGRTAEIDVFQDELQGLELVDFEFNAKEEKGKFVAPEFCLVEITHEEFIAGGYLAGKSYKDIEKFLKKYQYNKIRV